jgi:hypothetical protein
MNRRTLLHRSFVLGAGALLGTQIAGCSAPARSSGGSSASEDATAQPDDTAEPTAAAGSRVLLAYFSREGENYSYGGRTVLKVGNTAVVAEMISSTVAVDVFRIEAADPYPDSYDATVERNVWEQNGEVRPAIAGALPAVGPYDTVLLGGGIWNVRPPRIMRTFVESVDVTGQVSRARDRQVGLIIRYAKAGPPDTEAEARKPLEEPERDAGRSDDARAGDDEPAERPLTFAY